MFDISGDDITAADDDDGDTNETFHLKTLYDIEHTALTANSDKNENNSQNSGWTPHDDAPMRRGEQQLKKKALIHARARAFLCRGAAARRRQRLVDIFR